MGRIAAALVLSSQILLLWVAFEPSGRSAIPYTFIGHPLVAAGALLGLWALTRRLRQERRASRPARGGPATGGGRDARSPRGS